MNWFFDIPNEQFPLLIDSLRECAIASLYWTPILLFVIFVVRLVFSFVRFLIGRCRKKKEML